MPVRRGLLTVVLAAVLMLAPATAAPARPRAHRANAAHRCHRRHRHGHRARGCRRRHHHRHHRARAARLAPGHSRRRKVGGSGSSGSSTTGSGTTSPTATSTSTGSSSTTSLIGTVTAPASGPSIFWGAYIGDQFDGGHPPWDWNALIDFENTDAGGKAPSLLPFGALFYSSQWCGGDCTFPTSMFDKVRSAGMIPWFSWESVGASGYTDAQVASGAADGYITTWAQAAKAWGHPFFLRFDWEMNGNWFPWGVGANGNTAATYVAMWRHVHDIFTSVGASNVSWVWCPNIDTPPSTYDPLSNLYPGNSYVDWTCLDGYNGNDPWTSFRDLIAPTYSAITTIAPGKPMAVGETASTESGGSKATWITNLLSGLPSDFPDIHGLLWYDISSPGPGGHNDWPLETSTSAEAAFSAGIQSPVYTTSTYANLSASPIAPPS